MILFIVNPIAGQGGAERVLPRIHAFIAQHGLDHEIRYTEGQGHATELAEQNRDRFDAIVAVGGDGTVRETACGLLHCETPLGVLACGTGNDLIKALGIPADTEQALEVIRAGKTHKVDTGSVSGIPYINVAGFGFDVEVLKQTERYKIRHTGLKAYILGVISALTHMRDVPIRLIADGEVHETGSLITCVANGRMIGGGMQVAPRAELTDGLFDVLFTRNIPHWRVPFLLPKFIKGTHVRVKKYVSYFTAEQVDIETDFPLDVQVDGEVLSVDRLDFRLHRDSLRVLIP